MSRPFLERVASALLEFARKPPRPTRGRTFYAAAESHRLLLDWLSSCVGPDDELRGELRTLRSRARELERNNPYVEHFLRLAEVNVVGPHGPRLQVQARGSDGQLDDPGNALVETAWRRWGAGHVSVDRKLRLVPLLHVVLRTMLRDGEMFVRKFPGHPSNPFRFALQLVDPDLVPHDYNRAAGPEGPEIRMGVEVDEEGAPLAYWVAPYLANYSVRSVRASDLRRVPADEMVHLFVTKRANQTRGVPWIVSAMLPLRMLDKYEESEAIAARIGAAKMGMLVPKEEAMVPLKTGEEDQEQAGVEPASAPPQAEHLEANPGTFAKIPYGYDFETWNPDHPSTAFEFFRKGMLQKGASGMGASYPSLANDLEGVNYSSMRSGLLIERDVWQVIQAFLASEFVLPELYARWLPLAALSGELELPDPDFRRYLDARFQWRGWPWVDPLKDVEATRQGIAAGLTSRTIALGEQGYDVEEVFQHIAREKKLAAQFDIDVAIANPSPNPGDDRDARTPPLREALARALAESSGNGE